MTNGSNAKPRVKVARISVPKPQHVLASTLRDDILKGQLAEGDALPSERELVDQTGLSRGAVREALRTLAVEGLVTTRHGRFGGSVVTLPNSDSMATAINRFVQGRKLPLHTLQETREVLEPFLARLAAERRSDEQVIELKALHAELLAAVENFREFALINVRWHTAVAAASGNELLSTLLHSVSHGLEVATMAEEYNTAETRQQVIRIHARINDAIEARDSKLAERSMQQHILATHARPIALSANDDIPLFEEPAPAMAAAAPKRRARK
jgi:GntR family transcriptional regulator, transcriptional repressor for pyruvate dehydrogenase complex